MFLFDKAKAFKQKRRATGSSSLASADNDSPHRLSLILTIVSLALTILMVALDDTIISTAIPSITDEFHSTGDVGWYGSAYFLTTAAFQSLWGKALKYFDLKPVFILSILIFGLGSLIAGVSPSSPALIVGLAIAGVGAAGIAAGAYTIVGFIASPLRRPVFLGLMGALFGISASMGPLIGGALTSSLSWRWCFYINLPIAGVATLAALFFFKTPPEAGSLDVSLKEKLVQLNPLNVLLVLAAVVCYLLAMSYGGQSLPWKSSTVIGLIVGFALISTTFTVVDQLMGERALLPLRLWRQRAVATICPYVFFLTGGYAVSIYYMPIFFQSLDGISAAQSGIRSLALVLPLSIALVASGVIVKLTGYVKPNLVAGSCIAAIGCGLLSTLSQHSPPGKWIGYQIVVGAGVGMGWQQALVAVQASVGKDDLAIATSMVLFFQTIGYAFFISAGEAIFANRLRASLGSDSSQLDPYAITTSSATDLRDRYSGTVLTAVLQAYQAGIQAAFYLALASAAIAALCSFAVEWRKVNVDGSREERSLNGDVDGDDSIVLRERRPV